MRWLPFVVPYPAGSLADACAALERAARASGSAPVVIDPLPGAEPTGAVAHLNVTFKARCAGHARLALMEHLPRWPGVDGPELVADG